VKDAFNGGSQGNISFKANVKRGCYLGVCGHILSPRGCMAPNKRVYCQLAFSFRLEGHYPFDR